MVALFLCCYSDAVRSVQSNSNPGSKTADRFHSLSHAHTHTHITSVSMTMVGNETDKKPNVYTRNEPENKGANKSR